MAASERGAPSTITDLTGALQIRKRGAFRRRLKRIALVVLALLVVGAAVWLVAFSPVLIVKNVRVEGAELAGPDAVIAAAQVPMGRPLARTDISGVADRVLTIREIKTVKVGRSWPNTVSIEVTERGRVYQRYDAGVFGWVDAEGVIFHESLESAEPIVVHTATTDRRLLADVAVIVGAIPDDVRPLVLEIVASSIDQVILRLSTGQQVIWGSAEQSDLKAQVLPKLLTMPGTVFDVSSPANPAVR